MSANHIYLTGSDGFIGSWLKNYLKLPQERCFDILHGRDMCERQYQEMVCQENATLILLHAISGIKQCNDDPDRAHRTNTESIIQIAELAKKRGVKRIIFASSSSVYGEVNSYHIEEDHPTKPRSVYGASKLAAENIIKLSDSMEIIILRKSNVYGWGQYWKKTVIDNFISDNSKFLVNFQKQ